MCPYSIPIYSEKWSLHVLNFCKNLRNCACNGQRSPCCSPLALNWVSWFKINIEKCYCSAVLLCFKNGLQFFRLVFLAPFYIAFLSISPMCVLGIILSVPFPLPVSKYFCPAILSLKSQQRSELLMFSVHVFCKCQIFTDLAAGTDLHTFLMAAPMWQVPRLLLPQFLYLWATLSVLVMWVFAWPYLEPDSGNTSAFEI